MTCLPAAALLIFEHVRLLYVHVILNILHYSCNSALIAKNRILNTEYSLVEHVYEHRMRLQFSAIYEGSLLIKHRCEVAVIFLQYFDNLGLFFRGKI